MNTVSSATGFSGFQLHLGTSPRLILPIVKEPMDEVESPVQFMEQLTGDVGSAMDNLLEAKVTQAHHTNKHCTDAFPYWVGDLVWLSSKN
ncbi:hypothetical protein P691DRAFT_619522, partial [Macrolepiota fuliginosa MF-IS2]